MLGQFVGRRARFHHESIRSEKSVRIQRLSALQEDHAAMSGPNPEDSMSRSAFSLPRTNRSIGQESCDNTFYDGQR